MEDRKFRRATNVEKFAIKAKLDEILNQVGDGLYSYADDWTDDKVAKAIANDLNATHVQGVRRDFFPGKLVRGAAAGASPDLVARVETLEAQVEAMRLEIDALKRVRPGVEVGIGMTDKSAIVPAGDLLSNVSEDRAGRAA